MANKGMSNDVRGEEMEKQYGNSAECIYDTRTRGETEHGGRRRISVGRPSCHVLFKSHLIRT